jgi:ABC-type branched-subunit amino acid transport system permease subunit
MGVAMDIRASLRRGLLAGLVSLMLIVLGLTGLAGALTRNWFRPASAAPGAFLALAAVAAWGAVGAARRSSRPGWRGALVAGLAAGAPNALLVAVFVGSMSALVGSGAKVRQWLAQITPEAMATLTFGLSPWLGALVLGGVLLATALLAALAADLLPRLARRQRWPERWHTGREQLVRPLISRVWRQPGVPYAVGAIASVLLIVAPLVLGQYWNYTLGTVGIYAILGLGLNIVVGLAGILNLGYVAFFAIGAYSVALLTAPEPHGIQMSFWLALLIGVALATLTGVLLCIPVLRTRGDYLAIVTLGFGEIIRILTKSDVLTSFTGGPKGVRDIGGPVLLGLNLHNEMYFMYIIIIGIFLAALVTQRLHNSRVGRAWMAMREDEDVAQAMGIHTLKYKILAFAVGAAFAGLGGGIAASRNRFIGPEDLTLLVSINVLCLVIIGGMGSIPGVLVGALVLKGLPEMLRELDDYRFLVFGILLIVMMILRPQGLWPSARERVALGKAPVAPEPPRGGGSATEG